MSKPRQIKLTVGHRPIELPVIHNEETTLEAVADVNSLLREIEDASPIVDSLVFALHAAVSFAAELRQARMEHQAELERIKEAREEDRIDHEAERRKEAAEVTAILRELSERLRTILRTARERPHTETVE